MNKEKIIKKSQEYSNIINKNVSLKNKYYSIFYQPSTMNKYGISIPKKIGNAVKRNKIKRRIKNIIINNEKNIHTNYNYVIIVKEAINNLSYLEMTKELLSLFKRIK